VGLLERIHRIVLAGTGALPERDRQLVLNELADMRGPRFQRYQTYEAYYDGEIHTKLTGRLKTYLEAQGFGYSENFCETIVDALALCLELNDVVAENEQFSDWQKAVWQANRFDDLQGVVHTQVPMKGDGYVIVDWNDETQLPRFTFNRPELIRPVYDELGGMLVAAKTWTEAAAAKTNPEGAAIRRLNLYFPDRVEKWFTTSMVDPAKGEQTALWAPHQDLTDEAWPVPWLDRRDRPLGIAVLHFRNKPKGKPYGRSELHSVIPQQNYLTKQLVDLAETLDYQGAAQRWATGVESGDFRAAAGTVWTSKNEAARFGQFDPANPAGVLEAIDQTLRRMAARSQTPLHQLMTGGNQPSGETLRAARAPLVDKAKDRQTSYGGVWVDAHLLAMKLQALHDPGFRVPDDLQLEASWEAAEIADEKGELDAAEAKARLGVSKFTLLSEMGYDPEQEAQRRMEEAQAAAAAMVDAFNRGAGASGNGAPPPPAQPPPPNAGQAAAAAAARARP
jgi:hypothetical protein